MRIIFDVDSENIPNAYFLFAGELASLGAFYVDTLHDVEKLCFEYDVSCDLGSCVSVSYTEDTGEEGYLIYADFGNEYGILGQCDKKLMYAGMIENED